MNKENLGSVLRHARLSQGMTLMDIQKKSRGKISGVLVGNLERGDHKTPKPETLRCLAKILNLNFIGLMIMSGNLTPGDVDVIIAEHVRKRVSR